MNQFDGNCTVSHELVSYDNTAKLSWTSAGTYKKFLTSVEDGARKLQGKTIILSFIAKSAVAGSCSVYIGRGQTASTSTSLSSNDINLTTSWQKFTKTFTMPTYDNSNMTLVVGLISMQLLDSSNTVWIKEVQLEEGSIATPFDYRPYGLELSLCQRYLPLKIQAGYYGSYGSGYVSIGSTTTASITIPLATTSRSLVFSLLTNGNFQLVCGNATFTVTSFSIDTNNTDSRVLSLNVICSGGGLTGGNACTLRSANSPASYILLSNEL